jgi:ribose 5-phosphate isomerase B
MRVAVGCDHAGYDLKLQVLDVLAELGHEAIDLGTHSTASTDYPAWCALVGRAVARGEAERGIVIGGSGQGEQLAANKVRGVRASLCNDLYTARYARAHNDANVLSMGGRVVGTGLAADIVTAWFATPFEGGRHERRIAQLAELERTFSDPAAQDAYLASLVAELTGAPPSEPQPPSAST